MKLSTSALVLTAFVPLIYAQEPCMSATNTFTVKVNVYAGELGYYTFEECGEMVNPTILMEVGETYKFVQADRSNYFHPMGFAYFADGAHDDVNELEPGISESTSMCDSDLTCPAPMYFLGDEYLGAYSNIPDVLNVTMNEDDFGLDVYEPLFFRGVHEWNSFDDFSILLNFDDMDYSKDIFYFCHIHQFMTGRIKLTKNGELIQEANEPEIPYAYDMISEFDAGCGTHLLDPFQLPNEFCPDQFVCDTENVSPELKAFSSCIDAMNCHMLAGMTTGVSAESEVALFIHQMIPHHQNAVNMAKALLNTGTLDCGDLADEESDDCIMEGILWEIINTQNFQIQGMRGILESKGFPQTDNCEVSLAAGTSAASRGRLEKRGLAAVIPPFFV